jgi:hypothetical protein
VKFNKVVFVSYFPLNERTYKNFYFEESIQNNVQVNYLDLTALFFPDKINPNDLHFNGTVKINSYKELKNYLKSQDNENTLYVSIMTFEWRILRLFRMLTKYAENFAVFGAGVFPNSTVNNASRIIRFFKAMSFEKIKSYVTNKLIYFFKKSGFIKSYDFIFMAGDYGYWGLGIACDIDYGKAEIINVNTVDYDKFLLHKNLQSVNTEKFIVFLDQYLPYHPDASYFKIKTVEPEPYFKEMNAFFDRIELETGLQVVIAAHPKAELYKEINPYNSRALFFNQSNDLVKDAQFVLTHASTAISFPICYNKKLVLLVSDYLNEVLPQFFVVAKSIREACGATIIAMDRNDAILIEADINLEKYTDFKYKYLTSEKSENQLSQDIFVNFITKGLVTIK